MRPATGILAAIVLLASQLAAQVTPAPPAPAAQDPRDARLEQMARDMEALRARVLELEARDQAREQSDAEIQDRLGRLTVAGPTGAPTGIGVLKDWDFKFGGNVKVNLIHDFDAIGSENDFAQNTIPVSGTTAADKDGNTRFQARETRLSGTGLRQTSFGELKLYVEGDFAGGDGNSNNFRLRHAYADVGGFLVGQTWTTFMDDAYIPDTLDFDGPGTAVFDRRTQVRYTQAWSSTTKWSVALEEPNADIDDPEDVPGGPRNPFPDFVARVRYDEDRWHGQAAGVVREILFDGDPGFGDEQTLGWGLNLTGRYQTGEKDAVAAKLGFGEGIARYFQDLQGQDSDAVLKPDGRLDALPVVGWGVGYQHFWNDMLRSNFIYSALEVDNDGSQDGDAYHRTQYVAANLIYSPETWIDWGIETLYGTRENKDGADGSDRRVQMAFKYKF